MKHQTQFWNPSYFAGQLTTLNLAFESYGECTQVLKMDFSQFTQLRVFGISKLSFMEFTVHSTYHTTLIDTLETIFLDLPSKLKCLLFPFTRIGFKPFFRRPLPSLSELHTLYFIDSFDGHSAVDSLLDFPFTYLIAMEAEKFKEKYKCKVIRLDLDDDVKKSMENTTFWNCVKDFEAGKFDVRE